MTPAIVLLTTLFIALATAACTAPQARPADEPFELVGRVNGVVQTSPAGVVSGPPSTPGEGHAAVRRGALWYGISVDGGHLHVRLRLLDPSPHTTFFLPGPWAGHADFADDIALAGARGPHGPLAMTVQRAQGRLDVESPGVPWVELHYSVRLHRDAESERTYRARLHDDVFFAWAPTFLVLPSDGVSRTLRDIPIEVRVPERWQVVTTWPAAHSGPSRVDPTLRVHGFVADDVRGLRDAFVAAGGALATHHSLGMAAALGHDAPEGGPLTIAFEPPFREGRDALSARIAHIVSGFEARFGPQPSVTAYVRHADAMRGMGRRAGFVLELPERARIDDEALVLIAHEAFHMWNGHELVPDPEHERRTRWFKEGVTHYVALQTLRELGLIDDRAVRDELARVAQNYRRNPAVGGGQASSLDQVRLPYDQGVLLGLLLDATLRASSGGRTDLNTWLLELLDHARQSGEPYTEETLRRALGRVAGTDAAPVLATWEHHVTRGRPIDPAALFRSVGLHWLEGGPQAPARLLPLDEPDSLYRQMFRGE